MENSDNEIIIAVYSTGIKVRKNLLFHQKQVRCGEDSSI
jgi:hypothetical protein